MENWYWLGDVDERFCEQALKQLHGGRSRNVNIYLSTKGGKFDLAMFLYDVILEDRDRYTIIAGGTVASCGVTLLCACSPIQRIAYGHTRFMIHDLYASFKGTLGGAKFELSKTEKMQGVIDSIYRSEFDLDGLMSGTVPGSDVWFDAKTAKDVGLINSIR